MITPDDIVNWIGKHPDWIYNEECIIFEKEFFDFKEAFKFLNAVADVMESQNHHATIENTYNHVKLSLTTHDAGNVITDKDFKLAEAIEAL